MKSIAVIGCPNSGKSLLFNRLTGLNQKVANFPGATVGIHSGSLMANDELKLVDYPGIYSLDPISADEEIAVASFGKALSDPDVCSVLFVLDTTSLEKGLFFAQQVKASCDRNNKPLVIAANMIDVLASHNMRFDAAGLGRELGSPVIPVSARSGEGLDNLVAALQNLASEKQTPAHADTKPASVFAVDDNGLRNRAQAMARQYGPTGDYLLRSQEKIDRIVLHSWFGGIIFFLLMFLLFQSIFTWAAPLMDGVEMGLEWLSSIVLPAMGEGMAADFTRDALFGGVGAFLVFVPQIFILTVIVGLLEDSGYLARAAVICHKPLRMFGLTGKSFVPMLSGVACAIPGIYAARTVESPRKRWLTYMAIPLMPCSARLPVYTLLIAAFIPAKNALGGLVGLQGLAMFGIYLFGIMAALCVTAVVSASRDNKDDLPFVLEMPPYRIPSWRPLLSNAWERASRFVIDAGPIIFVVTVFVWLLGYFPNQGADLSTSWLGVLGHWIEPLFEPFGLDWRYGIAILTSFLAREVFVGTLGTLFGLSSDVENVLSLADQIQATQLPIASGLALLVFFSIAMQCISTLATLARESGSWRLPSQLFVSYSIFAYTAAWVTFWLFS